METSYETPNLINKGKNVGTCKNLFFFHITKINGKINFYTAVNIIHKFKVDSLRKFHTAMWLEDMKLSGFSKLLAISQYCK